MTLNVTNHDRRADGCLPNRRCFNDPLARSRRASRETSLLRAAGLLTKLRPARQTQDWPPGPASPPTSGPFRNRHKSVTGRCHCGVSSGTDTARSPTKRPKYRPNYPSKLKTKSRALRSKKGRVGNTHCATA